jgi:hypothetical protein
LILALSLVLLPQFTAAPQQLAPYGVPSTPPAVAQDLLGLQGGPATLEAFETYSVASGNAEGTGSFVIDDTTITGTGQGPGLVLDGCTYSCTTGIQWNGQAWFGQTSRNILGNGNALYLDYDNAQATVNFTLNAFDGFGDFVDLTAYDAAGNVVDSITGFSIPDATPVPATLSGSDIRRVEISTGSTYGWTGILDNHEYDQGFALSIPTLQSGAVNTVSTSRGVVGTTVLVAYSFAGGGPTNTPFGMMDLTMPVRQLAPENVDVNGETSANAFIPAFAAGRTVWVQALNLTGPGSGEFSNQIMGTIL